MCRANTCACRLCVGAVANDFPETFLGAASSLCSRRASPPAAAGDLLAWHHVVVLLCGGPGGGNESSRLHRRGVVCVRIRPDRPRHVWPQGAHPPRPVRPSVTVHPCVTVPIPSFARVPTAAGQRDGRTVAALFELRCCGRADTRRSRPHQRDRVGPSRGPCRGHCAGRRGARRAPGLAAAPTVHARHHDQGPSRGHSQQPGGELRPGARVIPPVHH